MLTDDDRRQYQLEDRTAVAFWAMVREFRTTLDKANIDTDILFTPTASQTVWANDIVRARRFQDDDEEDYEED